MRISLNDFRDLFDLVPECRDQLNTIGETETVRIPDTVQYLLKSSADDKVLPMLREIFPERIDIIASYVDRIGRSIHAREVLFDRDLILLPLPVSNATWSYTVHTWVEEWLKLIVGGYPVYGEEVFERVQHFLHIHGDKNDLGPYRYLAIDIQYCQFEEKKCE